MFTRILAGEAFKIATEKVPAIAPIPMSTLNRVFHDWTRDVCSLFSLPLLLERIPFSSLELNSLNFHCIGLLHNFKLWPKGIEYWPACVEQAEHHVRGEQYPHN